MWPTHDSTSLHDQQQLSARRFPFHLCQFEPHAGRRWTIWANLETFRGGAAYCHSITGHWYSSSSQLLFPFWSCPSGISFHCYYCHYCWRDYDVILTSMGWFNSKLDSLSNWQVTESFLWLSCSGGPCLILSIVLVFWLFVVSPARSLCLS